MEHQKSLRQSFDTCFWVKIAFWIRVRNLQWLFCTKKNSNKCWKVYWYTQSIAFNIFSLLFRLRLRFVLENQKSLRQSFDTRFWVKILFWIFVWNLQRLFCTENSIKCWKVFRYTKVFHLKMLPCPARGWYHQVGLYWSLWRWPGGSQGHNDAIGFYSTQWTNSYGIQFRFQCSPLKYIYI